MTISMASRLIPAIFFSYALMSLPASAANKVIRVNGAADGNASYVLEILNLALAKADTRYELQLDNTPVTQARNMDDVASGRMDLLWAATNIEMEKKLLPVRIPLYRGLLGHRIFIISPASQARFDRVKTFEDLKQFSFGQGTTWADSDILESNGLKVVRTNKYPGLFYMLDGGRFDAFPRGVQEPWAELENNKNLNLAVEKRIMLVYRMPLYFFTKHGNTQLAKDLEQGLNRAIADGSFNEVFFRHPIVRSAIEQANLHDRIMFMIDNPTLPKETPLDREELWFDINTLKKPVAAPEPAPTETAPVEPAPVETVTEPSVQ